MSLDLQKKLDLRKQLVLDISKKKGIENQKAQVILCLDISGSMHSMYNSGFVQQVLERVVPVAMQFDDNGEMELYLFQSTCKKHPSPVTVKNVDGLIRREIIGKYDFGGTNYAPPINMIVSDNGQSRPSGFLGMGKGTAAPMKQPAYVIFITDGENSDRPAAERAIINASLHGIFFQFVGIGNAGFPFLEKLDNLSGRFIDNANFFQVSDISRMSDEDLYDKLLGEFPSWLVQARQKNLIA